MMSELREPTIMEQTPADLAVAMPGATAVFRRHQLDFCCASKKVTLAEAAKAKQLDVASLAAELAALTPAGAGETWAEQSSEALVTVIETRFHAGHRRDLAELIRLARRVEAVHHDKPSAPQGLADLLREMLADLEQHMAKEEQVLFPLIRRGGHPMLAGPIAVMVAEHEGHGDRLRTIASLCHDFIPPEEACPTWRALYAGLQHVEGEVMEHIALENNVLFPRFVG